MKQGEPLALPEGWRPSSQGLSLHYPSQGLPRAPWELTFLGKQSSGIIQFILQGNTHNKQQEGIRAGLHSASHKACGEPQEGTRRPMGPGQHEPCTPQGQAKSTMERETLLYLCVPF